MTSLALQEWANACVALGQKCARVQHSCSLCEGAEVNDNWDTALLMQPLAGFLEQPLIPCRPLRQC